MFYNFDQNNSGGVFEGPNNVIIEADNAEQANYKAEQVGIYFDGVENDIDCDCCGDRWNRQYSDNDGTLSPLNGIDPEFYCDEIVIYYKNGHKVTLKKDENNA